MLPQKPDSQSNHFCMALALWTIALGINMRYSQHSQSLSFVLCLMLKISEHSMKKKKEGKKLISKRKRKLGPRKCTI